MEIKTVHDFAYCTFIAIMTWLVRFSDGVALSFNANATHFSTTNQFDGGFYAMYKHTNAHTLQLIDPELPKSVCRVPQFVGRCFVALYYFVRFMFPDVTNFHYKTGVEKVALSYMQRKRLEDAWENKSVDAAVNAVRSSVRWSIDFFTDKGTVDERLHKMANKFMQQDPCDTTLMANWDFSGNIMRFAPQYAIEKQWIINIEQNVAPVDLLLR